MRFVVPELITVVTGKDNHRFLQTIPLPLALGVHNDKLNLNEIKGKFAPLVRPVDQSELILLWLYWHGLSATTIKKDKNNSYSMQTERPTQVLH